MKRVDLIRHLHGEGCAVVREGGRHTIVRNVANGICTAVPRHREIKDSLVRAICRQLGITPPTSK